MPDAALTGRPTSWAAAVVAVLAIVAPSGIVGLLVPTPGWAAVAMAAVSLLALWLVTRWYRTMRVFGIWALAVIGSACVWAAGLAHLKVLWSMGPDPVVLSVSDLQVRCPPLPCYVMLTGILRPDYAKDETFRSVSRKRNGAVSTSLVRRGATPLVTPDWRPERPVPVLVSDSFWGERVRPIAWLGVLDAPSERGGSVGTMGLGWLQARPPRFRFDPNAVLVFERGSIQDRFRSRIAGDLLITLILVAVTLGVAWVVRRAMGPATPMDEGDRLGWLMGRRSGQRRQHGRRPGAAVAPVAAGYDVAFRPIDGAADRRTLTLGPDYPPGGQAQIDYPSELRAIGPYLAEFANLRELTIESAVLTELPDAITRLARLETLCIRAPRLAGRLPDLSALTALQSLTLAVGLETVPSWVVELPHLTVLDVRDNPIALSRHASLRAIYRQQGIRL